MKTSKKIFCHICQSRNVSRMDYLLGYYRCEFCKTVWKKKFLNTKYEEDYYEGKSGIITKLFTPIESFFYFIRNLYVGLNKKSLWVDVGGGEGKFLLSTKSKRKIGVEISNAGRKMMKELGLEAISEKEFLKSKNFNADIISYWHVLEHVENPLKYLRTGRENISKKGKIVIGIPNTESLDFKFFKKYWFHLAPNYHLWHFSPKSIRILLEKSNFKIKFVDYFSVEHHLPGILQSFINWSSRTDNVLHGLVKRNVNEKNISLKSIFWIFFWLTAGLPIVIAFWLTSSILRKAGTIVVVAVPK